MRTIGEVIQKSEQDFISGTTLKSKYVRFSLSETLDKIDAYHNSKFTSGEKDSLGREKPFFNISIASTNVWYRATDIDRSWIKVRANKSKNWINSFLANVQLHEWMKRERFGVYLNEWGRILAKYGSAVTKIVESNGELNISVVPWNSLIVDAVDFDANPKIEILELTEAQLRQRTETHGYDKEAVKDLIEAKVPRETTAKSKKDNISNYVKLYEIHGNLPLSYITGEDEDEDTYTQQMQIISFVGKKGTKDEKDFTLYKGKEDQDPYRIDSLIKEDGQTLAIGAVQALFEPQWMINHSMKAVKDNLDLSSKIIFQTADLNFVGRNALTNIEQGDILIHGLNTPLTQVANTSLDVVSVQNQANTWKTLGNEMTSVSEVMLGAAPKSGTAWRQTEAVLQESHSLFEVMTENKGLAIIDMLTERIIPFIKKSFDTSDEVSTILSQYDIDRIDKIWIKNKAIELTNGIIKEKILSGEELEPNEQEVLMGQTTENLKDNLSNLGNERFFKPSDLSDKTWKEQFKDMEWELDFDVTGEAKNIQEAMATLQTALTATLNPNFSTNKKAQAIVGRILEQAGAMSPVEYNAIQEDPQLPNTTQNVEPRSTEPILPINQK